MDYFFDSSALTKRYANEVGSPWVENILDLASGNTIFIADITQVEVTSAIFRKVRGNVIPLADANLAFSKLQFDIQDEYLVIDGNQTIIQTAVNLAKTHYLRGYDAIQLAFALEINRENLLLGASPITFVSADDKLNIAAQNEGLSVENPNNYP
jgi:uncharacterized protein